MNWISILPVLIAIAVYLSVRGISKRYPYIGDPFKGTLLKFQSAKVDWIPYRACLEIGINDHSLMMRSKFPPRFEINQPICGVKTYLINGVFFSYQRTVFEELPNTSVPISNKLATKLTSASAGRLSFDGT